MTHAGPVPLVVLISGNGSNLQAIIEAIARGHVPAEIRAVISNEANAFGLKRAQQVGIHTEIIDHHQYRDREAFDIELSHHIQAQHPRLVLLAGFMRIFTNKMIELFEGRMLNIHPSLLPHLRGLHTHRRALEAGMTHHGCSVHFVTRELDSGPVIIQATVPVRASDTPETLAARVLQKEHLIYPLAVRWFCEGRLALVDGAVVKDGEPLIEPVRLEDLSEHALND